MHPLQYHAGQVAVQEEANTRHVADKLAHWVGPAAAYAESADMVLLAACTDTESGPLRFSVLSGAAPIARPIGPGRIALAHPAERLVEDGGTVAVGGLVLSLERAERARINGRLEREDGQAVLVADEAFTLCRKYLAPSDAPRGEPMLGPTARDAIALDDAWVSGVVAAAHTAFLASIAPDGAPDVAHRGGPPGFIALDPAGRTASWTEFVGDGVFKSAGNIRATATASLLLLDLPTGDALELAGRCAYETTLTRFRPREEPLVRMRDPFPEQGRMTLAIEGAWRLRSLTHPRRELAVARVTSQDTPDEQAPR